MHGNLRKLHYPSRKVRVLCWFRFQALLEWTNHDEARRTPHLISFLDKIDLTEILPQVLIEVIQHPVVRGCPVIEKQIRDVLTKLISKKFDAGEPVEENEEEPIPKPTRLRCFYQQDVSLAIAVCLSFFLVIYLQ